MTISNRPRLATRITTAAVAVALTLSTLAIVEATEVPIAAAVVPPVVNTAANQVSADPLPTVQINGVVWDQEIVGNTVYAVGQFTQARPAGSPAGANETPRANVLAYNLSTGELLPGFVANTNSQVKTIDVAPDGSRIYIGGQFTQVNGVNRYRIAALNPTTGAVIAGFNAIASSTVNDLVVTSTTVYAGGIFNGAGPGATTPRTRLAAFAATNGALLAWAPTASSTVQTMLISPDGSRLFVGGNFLQLNSQSAYGMGALDPVTGALLPWSTNTVIKNGGSTNGAILDLSTDGTWIYGVGFTFGRETGNLEGVFKADPTTGAIQWVEDCHGDTYQSIPMNGYVYTASHAHFCGNTGGIPQSSDQHTDWGEYQRHSLSFKDEAAGTLRRDQWSYHNLEGLPAPSLTTWFPEWNAGTFTGQGQATWAVEGNGQYVTYGGEFTRINATNQQGLVRFAVRSIAPNGAGPRLAGDSFPVKVVSQTAGQVRLSFPSNFDRDDGVLSYDILRDGVVLETLSSQSTYFYQPAVSYLDTTAVPGQAYTYRVRARDPWGNAQLSNMYPITVATSGAPTTYANRVLKDGPVLYWRLGDPVAAVQAEDSAGVQTGAVSAMTFGRPGAIIGDPDTAVSPNGTSSRIVQPPLVNEQGLQERHAVRDELTVETWFRTTSTQGGRLLGFGDSNSGNSNSNTNDRVLYVTNNGRVEFGVRTRPEGTGTSSSRVNRTIESAAGLNNGQWHHVVGVLSSTGMRLFVDGVQVSSRTDVNSGNGYYGYWRVGADTLSGWTSQPSSTRLNGDIDEAAVYYKALDASQVASHWNVSGRGTGDPAPIAAFSSSAVDLTASFDATASSDPGGSIVAYAWDFGDGTTGTGAVPTPHTYAAGGTYNVTLTVTDDLGQPGTVQQPVTVVAPNVAPTAAFTSTTADLAVTVNGSGSTDTDGFIQTYAWDFGDGATDTGATPLPHTYAVAGTYNVTLTVTDDRGGVDDVVQPVVVTDPGAPTLFAADSFGRTVASGLGTADVGGVWTSSGAATNYSVTGGVGRQRMASAGGQLNSYLNSVSAQDVLATVDVAWDKVPDANGTYASLIVRRTGTSDYRVRIRAFNTKTTITLYRMVNNVETSLGVVTLPTLVYGSGDTFRLQLRAVGSGTTNLQAKVWRVGSAEPGFQITANDTTASLQGPGGVGLVSYLSGAATIAPVVASFDNLSVTAP